VLAAMGVEPQLARGAVRISLGWSTSEADVERLLSAWNTMISSLLNKHANAA
jgi:cysteine desulfurase